MKKLRNLNQLNRGIQKHWIWGNTNNFYRSCDFIQKINYSIQDLNSEIEKLTAPTMKEVIYVIVLVDWVCEAVESIQKLLLKGIVADFKYKDEKLILQTRAYLKAIRSFVVAHPLNTDRHRHYGLDGDFICVDVRQKASPFMQMGSNVERWYHLGLDGMKENAVNTSADFLLYTYSEKSTGNKFFEIIGANFSDLYYVAEVQIEKLYALDQYLGKLKKKKWCRNE